MVLPSGIACDLQGGRLPVGPQSGRRARCRDNPLHRTHTCASASSLHVPACCTSLPGDARAFGQLPPSPTPPHCPPPLAHPLCSVLAPGNTRVCRPLPYTGQFVTCLGEGSTCQQPVQLRANCSSNLPGEWVGGAALRLLRPQCQLLLPSRGRPKARSNVRPGPTRAATCAQLTKPWQAG